MDTKNYVMNPGSAMGAIVIMVLLCLNAIRGQAAENLSHGYFRDGIEAEYIQLADSRTAVINLTVRVVNNSRNVYTHRGKAYSFPSVEAKEKFKARVEKYGLDIKELGLEAYQFGFSPDRLVVKKNDTVRIHTSSRDTTHSIYIREYGVFAIVKKGEENNIEFIADKTGEFDIICLIDCEPEDIEMKAELIVEE